MRAAAVDNKGTDPRRRQSLMCSALSAWDDPAPPVMSNAKQSRARRRARLSANRPADGPNHGAVLHASRPACTYKVQAAVTAMRGRRPDTKTAAKLPGRTFRARRVAAHPESRSHALLRAAPLKPGSQDRDRPRSTRGDLPLGGSKTPAPTGGFHGEPRTALWRGRRRNPPRGIGVSIGQPDARPLRAH